MYQMHSLQTMSRPYPITAGWQGVTFSHALNMVTGTVGSEILEHLYSTLIVAETAEEAINNIAGLGDAPEPPGQAFNYASTNLFVLSYALQQVCREKEMEWSTTGI